MSDSRPRQISSAPAPKRIGKAPDPVQIDKDVDPKQISTRSQTPHTLVIDVGGTGTKMIVIDALGHPISERTRELTPKRADPRAVLKVVGAMVSAQPPFDRVSVGFPGVVRQGVVHSAANLDARAWPGFDLAGTLAARVHRPVRVLNDADLQGYGVCIGKGVELVLTLGTGMGAAFFTEGHLMPNCELGLHPFHKGQSYEQRVGERARKRVGKQRWRQRMHRVLDQLQATFNPDIIWIGGGNAKRLRPEDIPQNGRVFDNVAGLRGGVRLWQDLDPKPVLSR